MWVMLFATKFEPTSLLYCVIQIPGQQLLSVRVLVCLSMITVTIMVLTAEWYGASRGSVFILTFVFNIFF